MFEMCTVNASETVDPNILFLMKDFHTISDIVDKGPNNIWVTNGGSGVMIGEDVHGTYMGLSNNRFLEIANSPVLSRDEVDLEMHVGNITVPGTGYGPCIVDNRPTNTNGNYFILGHMATAPLRFLVNYALIESDPIPLIENFNKIKMKIRTTGYTVFVNDVQVFTQQQSCTFQNQRIKIGRSAYHGSGVADFVGRVYYFSISKPSSQG